MKRLRKEFSPKRLSGNAHQRRVERRKRKLRSRLMDAMMRVANEQWVRDVFGSEEAFVEFLVPSRSRLTGLPINKDDYVWPIGGAR